jgi:hypothetical protein
MGWPYVVEERGDRFVLVDRRAEGNAPVETFTDGTLARVRAARLNDALRRAPARGPEVNRGHNYGGGRRRTC